MLSTQNGTTLTEVSIEQIGLSLQSTEELDTEDDAVVVFTMGAIGEAKGFEDPRSEFEELYSVSETKDYALRLLCARMFRAGQLAERQVCIKLLS